MRRWVLLGLALAGLAIVASIATAATGLADSAKQDIAWLNAQRTANGIPGPVTQDAKLSAGCDAHITYMQKTHIFGGVEDPASPFYTAAGSQAGASSVLAEGRKWGPSKNPWESSPLHLVLLLDPQLSSLGIADRGGYICATPRLGYHRALPHTTSVVAYPGNGATIYTSEHANELPFTPGSVVGLNGVTGPNLFVYVWGRILQNAYAARQISVTSASLTGPGGAVTLKWVDDTTSQIGPYMPAAAGILIPVSPLRPGSTYRATVKFSDHAHYAWTFKTKRG